jgi:hypothetical protein
VPHRQGSAQVLRGTRRRGQGTEGMLEYTRECTGGEGVGKEATEGRGREDDGSRHLQGAEETGRG